MPYRIGIIGGDVRGRQQRSRRPGWPPHRGGLRWSRWTRRSEESLADFDAVAVLGGRQITARTPRPPRDCATSRGSARIRPDRRARVHRGRRAVTTIYWAVRCPMDPGRVDPGPRGAHNLVQKHRIVEHGTGAKVWWRGEHRRLDHRDRRLRRHRLRAGGDAVAWATRCSGSTGGSIRSPSSWACGWPGSTSAGRGGHRGALRRPDARDAG